jgi:hypothetical protein
MADLASLARTPESAPMGTGLASMARNTITGRKAYKNYVIETQSAGETPVSFEEFMKKPEGSNS